MNKEYKMFLNEYNSLMQTYNNELETALKGAGDKKRALSLYYGKYKQAFFQNEKILIKLNSINHFFKDMEDLQALDASLSTPVAFKQTFKVNDVDCNEENIKIIAKNKALIDILNIMDEKAKEMIDNHNLDKLPGSNYWIGEETTEFVQLMYALIESGRLQSNNKIEMITNIANFLGIVLAKNWRSNNSKSVHNRNNDYEPSIFKELQQGWQKYNSNQMKKK
jgi:hypothetical protein